MTDKRQATRYDVEVSAEVYTAEDMLTASTRNLSETGCCLVTDRGLGEGATVGISLILTSDGIEDPDVEPLNVKAEVIWATESDEASHMSGTKFESLAPEKNDILKQFLDALD